MIENRLRAAVLVDKLALVMEDWVVDQSVDAVNSGTLPLSSSIKRIPEIVVVVAGEWPSSSLARMRMQA